MCFCLKFQKADENLLEYEPIFVGEKNDVLFTFEWH